MARFKTKKEVSTWRKLSFGTWGPPNSPTAYGALEVECDAALAYLVALRAESGEKVTLTHLAGKAVAIAIAESPEVNGFVSLGRLVLRDTVDIFYQVAFFDEAAPRHADTGSREKERGARRDANLAGAKVERVDEKSVVEIARALREEAQKIREGREAASTRATKRLSRVPGPLISAAARVGAFLSYDLRVDLRRLGMPHDAFGSCMVTNVGTFGISMAWAPLIPLARCPIILTLGAVKDAPAVKDGKVTVVKQMSIGVAFDHRILDGYHAGVLARRFEEIFAHPEDALGR
jgi:pyruvate dehydrogenase E2 component (dihydrolipoamide acetyltransferase)